MTRVKICGITNVDDALAAVEAGADALGFVFAASSPRRVSRETVRDIVGALPPFVTKVGVFVDAPLGEVKQTLEFCGLDLAQLHGEESPEDCLALFPRAIKAVRLRSGEDLERMARYKVRAYLVDAYGPDKQGGTGTCCDWQLARQAAANGRPVILAGGLTPENVHQAIAIVHPYAVDVSSGVEMAPGKKDFAKLRAFVEIARRAGTGRSWRGIV